MSFFSRIFGKRIEPEKETSKLKYITELNSKYFRNLDLMVDYDISIDCYCDIFETWNDKPLNSDKTYSETHKTVKQILEDEYCEEICEKIKAGNFTEEEAQKLIVELDAQYSLYKSECEYTKATEDDLLEKFKKGEI